MKKNNIIYVLVSILVIVVIALLISTSHGGDRDATKMASCVERYSGEVVTLEDGSWTCEIDDSQKAINTVYSSRFEIEDIDGWSFYSDPYKENTSLDVFEGSADYEGGRYTGTTTFDLQRIVVLDDKTFIVPVAIDLGADSPTDQQESSYLISFSLEKKSRSKLPQPGKFIDSYNIEGNIAGLSLLEENIILVYSLAANGAVVETILNIDENGEISSN